MHYICAIHTERNATNTSIFNNYVNVTHPNDGGNIDLIVVPKNTAIIKLIILDKRNWRCSGSVEIKVYTKYGGIYATTYQTKNIEPAMKIFMWFSIDA